MTAPSGKYSGDTNIIVFNASALNGTCCCPHASSVLMSGAGIQCDGEEPTVVRIQVVPQQLL